MIPLSRSSIIAPIVAFLRHAGAPAERLLARAKLPGWILDDSERLIPTASAVRFLATSAHIEGVANLGLLAGQHARVDGLGLWGRLICRESTLGDALQAAVENYPLFTTNGHLWLTVADEQVRLCQAFTTPFVEGRQQTDHYCLMVMLAILRLGAGPTWQPALVELQTGESDALRDAAALSTARIVFDRPATAITFPRALLGAPVAPHGLDAEPCEGAMETWRASAPADETVAAVTQVLHTLLRTGRPSVPATAALLGMSARTLQRRLDAGGVSHHGLVERARFAAASALLERTARPIMEVAFELGYSDHAHFTRAFRRWSGCSPRDFRLKVRAGADDVPHAPL